MLDDVDDLNDPGRLPHVAMRSRLLARLDGPERVVGVCAPPGFGKSTLLTQWLQSTSPGRVVARVNAEAVIGCRVAGTIWHHFETSIKRALIRAGECGRSIHDRYPRSEASPDSVASLLQDCAREVTLIVDSVEHLTDRSALLRLSGQKRTMRLVMAGRVDTTGDLLALADEVTVLDERDLRLSTGETALVLRSAAPGISDGDIAFAHRELFGWPAAIRELASVLHARDASSTVDAAVRSVMDTMCTELGFAVGDGYLDWMGPLSLVDSFDTDLAGSLLGAWSGSRGGDAPHLLDRMARNGFVKMVKTAADRESELLWSPTLRAVIARCFAEKDPGLVSQIQAVVVMHYIALGRPRLALVHAARAGRWDLLGELFDHHPLALIGVRWSDFACTFANGLRNSHPDEAPQDGSHRDSIGAILLRAIALDLPLSPEVLPSAEPLEDEEIGRLLASTGARRLLERQIWLLDVFTRRSMSAQAAVCESNVTTVLGALVEHSPEDAVGLRSLALFHSGRFRAIDGDFLAAAMLLEEAHACSALSEVPLSRGDIAGRVALSFVMLGDQRKAMRWIERSCDAFADSEPGELHCALLTAQAIVAARSLDRDRCTAALGMLDELEGTSTYEELVCFVSYAAATCALVWEDRNDALDLLDASVVSRQMTGRPAPVCGRSGVVLAAIRAELLIAVGRGNEAVAVLDSVPSSHPLLLIARARLAMLGGDDERAVELASSTIARTGNGSHPEDTPSAPLRHIPFFPVHRLECLVISSIARNRLGQRESALEDLGHAARQASLLSCTLPFAGVPRSELTDLLDLAPDAVLAIGGDSFFETPQIYPSKVSTVTLTKRESEILACMADGMDLRRIASAGYVSINTVKTQLRTLYRKLDVSSRDQALSVATELRLLAP